MNKLYEVIGLLSNGFKLDSKYLNHKLVNDKEYRECFECHIEPDWLLIYKIWDSNLVLILVATGSHSEILDK